jgi:hypothetical protein
MADPRAAGVVPLIGMYLNVYYGHRVIPSPLPASMPFRSRQSRQAHDMRGSGATGDRQAGLVYNADLRFGGDARQSLTHLSPSRPS